ncbi:MAG: SURF1 family protein [Limimaricola sp.]|uniref:SURF1 family protein n=1 Tax=Limimaricola sp. TaxID=2211665 RepID=UPI001D8BB1BB|nr:SURF1 family protein [Limimaricola sp.]MBI1419003.1 SURF1 family protein [Limimaricola sp.]
MRRVIFPVLLGLFGISVLCGLGIWQVQRLHWKEAMLAEIAARMAAPPAPLPATPDPDKDRFRPVTVVGHTTGQELDVLTSTEVLGPGYRIISGFVTDDGRKIMVDLGFVPQPNKDQPRPATPLTVTGNLNWPQEKDSFTPAPDASNIWFARDVPTMSVALGTDPVMIVASALSPNDLGVTPLPIDSLGIPNNHLQYAITWFLMALAWAAMTVLLIRRTLRRKD